MTKQFFLAAQNVCKAITSCELGLLGCERHSETKWCHHTI